MNRKLSFPGFEDVAAMSESVEQRGCHLRVAEDGRPFAKAEIGRDDDAGLLVELAQQVEEQGSAGGAERQVAEFVEDDEVGVRERRCDLPGLALKLLLFEGVDAFDGGEEPDAFAVMLDRPDADRRGEMGFCPGSRRIGLDPESFMPVRIAFISGLHDLRHDPRCPQVRSSTQLDPAFQNRIFSRWGFRGVASQPFRCRRHSSARRMPSRPPI